MSRYNWMIAGICLLFLSVAGYLVMSARADMAEMTRDRAKSAEVNKEILAERKKMTALEKKAAPKNIMSRVGEKVVTEFDTDHMLSAEARMISYKKGMDVDRFLKLGSMRVLLFGSADCEGCSYLEEEMRKGLGQTPKAVYLYIDGSKYPKMMKKYGVTDYPTIILTDRDSDGKNDVVYRRTYTEFTKGEASEVMIAVGKVSGDKK